MNIIPLFGRILLLFSLVFVPATATLYAESVRADSGTQLLPFVTLRNKVDSGDVDDYFGDERDGMHSGVCELHHTSLNSFDAFNAFKSFAQNGYFYIPDNIIQIKAIREQGGKEFWHDAKQVAAGARPVLYIHGYNMSFARSCKQASLFQSNLGLDGRLLLFSWPSDGALLNYARDEVDIQWSIAPLEETLNRMIEQFGVGGFDVVAHSLGTRGLFYALTLMAHEQGRSLPLLNQLVLVAPDIDADIFKQYLPSIRPLVENISLYVSANDKPLALSREVHGYPRLGESGAHLEGLAGVEIINISDIGVRSFSGHLYHLYHDSVIRDLSLLLNEGLSANQRETLQQTVAGQWRLLPLAE